MLASRGPVYGTAEDAGGYGNRYHDDCDCIPVPVKGSWVPDGSQRGAHWEGQDPGYDHDKLYNEEYKPYWQPGDTLKDVITRKHDDRAAGVWGGNMRLSELLANPPQMPSWWDDTTLEKTLHGHWSVNGKGVAKYSGGHKFGEGRAGKTEFPQRWDDETIKLAVAETWMNPCAVTYSGRRKKTRKVIDGVLVEASAYGEDYSVFFSAYPKGGRGVVDNDRMKGRVGRRIPRDTSGWEVL